MPDFVVSLSETDADLLREIVSDDAWSVAADVRSLLEHLAQSAADGVRRPGSWERGWLTQATGWPQFRP